MNIVKKYLSRKIRELTTFNQFHNILRLFNVLPNFPFTAGEVMGGYYLETRHIRATSRVAERLNT